MLRKISCSYRLMHRVPFAVAFQGNSGPDYFVRHLAQSTPVKNGWPKGLRYPVKLTFWPLPKRDS